MINTAIPKFTYVIPYRFHNENIITLRRIIDWLSGFQGGEVIIIEQDKHSKISHLTLRAKHVFLYNEGVYNLSWAYNYVVKRTISPIIIFGNSYTIMNPNELIESLKVLDGFDCVIPCDKSISLNQRESLSDFNSIISTRNGVLKQFKLDGISIFKREAIWNIGCWEEQALDNDVFYIQDHKVSTMLNCGKLNYTEYVLYHVVEDLNPSLLERSKVITKQISDFDKPKLYQYINSIQSKIGLENKNQLV